MNAFIASEGQIDMSILYFVKINLGICFYKIGLLDEAFTCFETCLMSIKKQNRHPNINAILVKLYFQTCILQSELSNHERALYFGKKATKTIISQFMDQLIILSQKLYNYQQSLVAISLSQQRSLQSRKTDQKQTLDTDYYYGPPFLNQQKRIPFKADTSVDSSSNSVTQIDPQSDSFYNLNSKINGYNLSEEELLESVSQQNSNILDIDAASISLNAQGQNFKNLSNIQNGNNNQNFPNNQNGNNKIANKRKLLEIQTSGNNESFYISNQENESASEISGGKAKEFKHIIQQSSSETQTVVSEFDTQVNLRKIEVVQDLTDLEKNIFMLIKSVLSKVLDMPTLLSAKKYSVLQNIFRNQLLSSIEANFSSLPQENGNNNEGNDDTSSFSQKSQHSQKSPVRQKTHQQQKSQPRQKTAPTPSYLSTFSDKINLKEIFKFSESALQKSNILGQLQLKPMSLDSIRVSIPNELSERLLLFNAQLSVGLYCISTEYRFIEQPQGNIRKDNCDEISQSENYLSRALEIAFVYLPHEVPLVGQIMSVHTKFHAAFRQCIYEDQPDQKNHILIRSLPGGSKAPFFIPLIRKKPEQFQINSSKILNTDLIQQQKDYARQEKLHLDAHPTEEFQHDSESDRGLFSIEESQTTQNQLNHLNANNDNSKHIQQQQINYYKQKRPSISREKSAEGTSRKNRKPSDVLEKIYKSNKIINGATIQQINNQNEMRQRQNRTLDPPPSKTRSINTGSVTIHNSFVNTPSHISPQNAISNNIQAFSLNSRQPKSVDRQTIDVNNSQRSIEFMNSAQIQAQQTKTGNYLNKLKIMTKPPLLQRIQQMINSQQNHVSPLSTSQIQQGSHERQIEKEIFQLQIKQQNAQKQNEAATNNFLNSGDDSMKYRLQTNLSQQQQQNNANISYNNQIVSNQMINGILSSGGSASQKAQYIHNSSSAPQNSALQPQPPTNPAQKKKRNFNIQINNNINFFIQNGSNDSSLNNSFHNSNQIPDNPNENIPSKSFNNTPQSTNRQQYSRQNKHTNKSQNSNNNNSINNSMNNNISSNIINNNNNSSINSNISTLINEGAVILKQDRSNSLNHPAASSKRQHHKNINSSSIQYNSAQNSPNSSFQILNNSTPQNSQTLFPLSVRNKNIHQGQQLNNNPPPNQIVIPQQIQILSNNPQSTKNKPSQQLREIILATGNQSAKNQGNAQENPIQFGFPSSAKNTYINNKNLRKFKLASELINF